MKWVCHEINQTNTTIFRAETEEEHSSLAKVCSFFVDIIIPDCGVIQAQLFLSPTIAGRTGTAGAGDVLRRVAGGCKFRGLTGDKLPDESEALELPGRRVLPTLRRPAGSGDGGLAGGCLFSGGGAGDLARFPPGPSTGRADVTGPVDGIDCSLYSKNGTKKCEKIAEFWVSRVGLRSEVENLVRNDDNFFERKEWIEWFGERSEGDDRRGAKNGCV